MEGSKKDLRRKNVRAYLAEDSPDFREEGSYRNDMPGDLPSRRKKKRGPVLFLFILVIAVSLGIGFAVGKFYQRPFAIAGTTNLDKDQIVKKLSLLEQFING